MDHSPLAELAPHSVCLLADPLILWGYVWSHLGFFAAYMAIPVGLQLMRPAMLKIDGLVAQTFDHLDPSGVSAIRGSLIYLFQAFVLACGLSHAMAVVTMFWPFYAAGLAVNVAGAVVSVAVGVAVILAGLRMRRTR